MTKAKDRRTAAVRLVSAVVPAAGKGERFGAQKLLANIDGRPLLDHTLHSLIEGGVGQVVLVTAPGVDLGTVPLVADARVTRVVNPDPSRGMFSSIQVGLTKVSGDPILVLPGDMPFVRPETVTMLVAASLEYRGVVVPRVGGQRGHPVAIAGDLRELILAARPAATLSELLKALAVSRLEVDVPDAGILRDVDVASDLRSPL